MCQLTAYKSESCSHRWMTITKFCAPNHGFTLTPHHEFSPSDTKFLSGKPVFEVAAANTCPNCDKRGQYDGNVTRMVMRQNGAGCRVACGIGGPPAGIYGGGQQVHGYGYGSVYYPGGPMVVAPGMAYQSGIMPGQILSPLQQQIEAIRVQAEIRKMQFHPNQEKDESRCCVM